MSYFNSPLLTGNQSFVVPAHAQCWVQADSEYHVWVNEDKKLFFPNNDGVVYLPAQSIDYTLDVVMDLQTAHLGYTFHVTNPADPADPVPTEAPAEFTRPLTLEERLHKFVASMVAERFGNDAGAVETLEESMDFDLDEDGLIGYEIPDSPLDVPPVESGMTIQPSVTTERSPEPLPSPPAVSTPAS